MVTRVVRGRRSRQLLSFALVACALACGLALAEPGAAAPWCGTVATADRPAVMGGRTIHVLYAAASDGPDLSVQRAPTISANVDEIAAWWRTQDFDREPRFDLAPFTCGPQADIVLTRLTWSSGDLRPLATRARRILESLDALGLDSTYAKYLVYYDGPVEEEHICGQGGGSATGSGAAIVYLQACADISTGLVAAHELLHAFGVLHRGGGPPHACPDDPGHPCDSTGDVMFPYAPFVQLGVLALDVGKDDYYGHSGSWPDVQDSPWLRVLSGQVELSIGLAGGGRVTSDVPGVDCAAACSTQWNRGEDVTLTAEPSDGLRFVRWSGACNGAGPCVLRLADSASAAALFAPLTYRLSLSVTGRGQIRGAPGGVACPARCSSSLRSYAPVTLRATPAKGWRLQRWAGACQSTKPTCTVPMRSNATARAVFSQSKR